MKILQLTFSLTSGGAEKFTVDLANKLAETNEVYFCVILSEKYKIHSFFRSQIKKNINYINLGCSKGININTFFSIFKLINKIKPDIIHFHLNTILYLYLPALLYRNRIKFIHTLHSIAPKTIGFKWQRSVNRIFYGRELINAVAISHENMKSFFEYYSHKNISLIYNGVADPVKSCKFQIVNKELQNFKRKLSDKIFIHVASFEKAKNQKILINVFNKLLVEDQGVILLVIGKHFDSEDAKKLKEISNKGIYYLGTRENISDYLLGSDGFVLSSLWEGLPISLLEALSCGVIPICTPAGGIRDVIKDETIGFLSKDFTDNGLYQAVINCLNSMDTFNRSNLKKYFRENYSIEKCTNRYLKIYKS